MMTSTDIAIKVREVLQSANIEGLQIGWSRHYDIVKEAVIVPHASDGEGSFRNAVVYINVHVKDIKMGANNTFETDLSELNRLSKAVSEALKNHVIIGTGCNWVVSSIMAPIDEPNKNEHFVSVMLTAYIRNN